MEDARATIKYLRVAPRKARLVADLIRGLSAGEAEAELLLSPKRAASHLLKLLRGAIANAKEGKKNIQTLFVKEIRVDGGPMLKRWRPRARGSAGRIQKHTSHITIVLGALDKAPKRGFVVLKKEKHDKEKHVKEAKEKTKQPKEKRSRLAEETGASAKRAEKEIEKKGAETIKEKKTFFRRKSV